MKGKGFFVAATGQNIGKTTTSLALFYKLRERYPHLSFMKPVGQRTIEVEGVHADEDVFLMREVFKLKDRANIMSPVTVPTGFTKDYLDGKTDNKTLAHSITQCWKELAGGKNDMVVVEGTGHAGVGSVFDMNNAHVAKLLGIPVIMITTGGIGRPLDELALNLALFEKEGVSVAGVIFNKAQKDKLEQVRNYGAKYLNKRGIPVLGVVEYSSILATPSIRRLQRDLKTEILGGEVYMDRVPTNMCIGAGSLDYILDKAGENTLIVTPASRSDIIIAAAHNFSLHHRKEHPSRLEFIGMVLTGDQDPKPEVLEVAVQSGIPILRIHKDVYETVHCINQSLGKILPTDREKLEVINRLYEKGLDWDLLGEIIEKKQSK